MADVDTEPFVSCSVCKTPKPASEFYKKNKQCKTCKRDRMLIKKRGSSNKYEQDRLEGQGNVCDICETPIRLCDASRGATATRAKAKEEADAAAPVVPVAVGDHCHVCETPRGMLCGPCNLGLGHFYDSPHRLRQAAAYIERWRNVGGHVKCRVIEEPSPVLIDNDGKGPVPVPYRKVPLLNGGHPLTESGIILTEDDDSDEEEKSCSACGAASPRSTHTCPNR